MSRSNDVKPEPTAEEIERVAEAARAAWCKGADWPAVAVAAILAMDRRASPDAEPVLWQAWRSNDWEAEGKPDWIEFNDEESARGWAKGCHFNGVRPLYASPPAPAVAVPEGLAGRLNHCAALLEGLETLPKPYELYYAVKNEGEGTGWFYCCAGIGVSDIRAAADAIATVPEPPATRSYAEGIEAAAKWHDSRVKEADEFLRRLPKRLNGREENPEWMAWADTSINHTNHATAIRSLAQEPRDDQ